MTTTTSTCTDATRQSAAFAEAMNTWTRTWLGTWQQTADSVLRAFGPSAGHGEGTRQVSGVDEALAPLRRQASSFYRGLADLTATGSAGMAQLGGEQARFLARIGERGFDCVCGPQPARTTEAFLATAQSMTGDLLENAALVGERLAHMGTQAMERIAALAGTPAKACCGGAGDSSASR